MRIAVLVTSLTMLAACSGTGGTSVSDGQDLEVATRSDGVATEVVFRHDAGDIADGFPFFEGRSDEDTDVSLQCAPGEGCFLDKCSENNDCQSGWCVQHLGEGVCSQTCQDECPPGWTCRQVAGTDPDLVYVCVSEFANLCRPCADNTDCTSVGGANDACIDYGAAGSFCGGPCAANGECPWGFSCQEATTVEGSKLQQCVNDTGDCPCTASSIALGLTTPCSVENDFGTCHGKRTCLQNGLSACDAAIPATESCNGLDDDCDGETDEPTLDGGNYVNLCDDDNDCTDDECFGQGGCANTPLLSGPCEDGNPCTVADHCVDGTCMGDPVECNDGNPCTDDVCTDTGGCEYPTNDELCDDGNPCTLADHCSDGACVGTDMACECQQNDDCLALEDGNVCNGTLACDKAKLPYLCVVAEETKVTCPPAQGDNAFCLQPHCDPGTGECSFVSDHEGFLCDNGDACTFNDKCLDGVCTGGSVINCNDGNACTDDSCSPSEGCVHSPNVLPCNDGNLCTTGDLCTAGECVGGVQVDCDDGNVCTDDSCTAETGCQFTANSAPCSDDNACTTSDHCSGGTCVPGPASACDDGNACTDDSCAPETGCIHLVNQAPCDDQNACTVDDVCLQGQCVGSGSLVCDDGNVCTNDSCAPETGCIHLANQAPCDDQNACTPDDVCLQGQCVGSGSLVCDDGNVCTDDSCAQETGCVHSANEDPCDDGNACTSNDACNDGTCQAGELVSCKDDDPCTLDECEPEKGCVFTVVPNCCDNVHGNIELAYSGDIHYWVVPPCVTEILVEVWGGQGSGSGSCGSGVQEFGGKGGYSKGYLAVTPGEMLYVYIGGKGKVDGSGGWNGGGAGSPYGASTGGGGGGGATDVRRGGFGLDKRLVVAGGGGAANYSCNDFNQFGGKGGGLVGGTGVGVLGKYGGGGTQELGGNAGVGCFPGSFGIGGGESVEFVGGGGGGWYGGGCGYSAGGGGGSGYVGGVAAGESVAGSRSGDGMARFSW